MPVISSRRWPRAVIALFAALVLPVFLAAAPARAAGLDLSAYKGKVVYLDFWASWCRPCLQSFPWMNDLADRYKGRGLVVVAINVDQEHALAEDFLRQHPTDFHVLFDLDGSIADRYQVKAMPTSFLIGRDGKVHYVHSGFYPEKIGDYLAQIRALLNQKAS